MSILKTLKTVATQLVNKITLSEATPKTTLKSIPNQCDAFIIPSTNLKCTAHHTTAPPQIFSLLNLFLKRRREYDVKKSNVSSINLVIKKNLIEEEDSENLLDIGVDEIRHGGILVEFPLGISCVGLNKGGGRYSYPKGGGFGVCPILINNYNTSR
jgi:hypothetical protein